MQRRYPDHPIVTVGAVVIDRGRLLLIRRSTEPNRRKWTVPGGVVELGERVVDAVLRETREECGLEIEVTDKRPICVGDNIIGGKGDMPEYHYVIVNFLCRARGGRLKRSHEVEEALWVPLGEVEGYDLTPGFRAFFEEYGGRLNQSKNRRLQT